MSEDFHDRDGDAIAIPGDYQFRALKTGYAPQRFWHSAKLREAHAMLAPTAGDIILDAGCGSGMLVSLLASQGRAKIIGIDSNPAAIEFAQSTFQSENILFRESTIDAIDFPVGSLNKIACLEVIEHMPKNQVMRVLKKFNALLSDGGSLVISTPNKRSFWPLLEWTIDHLHLAAHMAEVQHVSEYDRLSLEKMLGDAGFQIVQCLTINFLAPFFSLVSEKLAQKIESFERKLLCGWGALLIVHCVKNTKLLPSS